MGKVFHICSSLVLQTIIASVGALCILSGCGSKKSSIKRGGSGQAVAVTAPVTKVDISQYTRDLTDPMQRALVAEAGNWLGTRYLYGGQTKNGTDCSGLVMSLYNDVCGLKIPRTTREQVRYCTLIARNKLLPGDLIFFGHISGDPKGTAEDPDLVSHVGLYIGEGKMIHASSSRGVIVSGVDSGYWGDRYFTAARIDEAPRAWAANGKRGKESPAPTPDLPTSDVPIPDLPTPDVMLAMEIPAPAVDIAVSAPATDRVVSVATVDSVASAPATTVSTIDLLDLIINQKVDSIFTSQFTD